MCGRLASELRYCYTVPDLVSYWRTRFHWSKAQVALVDLLGTKQALAKLSSDSKRRLQKLRCGWLPVNRRVSRKDPDRLNGCSACLPTVEETVDHIFQCPCRSCRRAMRDRLAGMSKAFRERKTSRPLIKALRCDALAWIEGREIPDVEGLRLPNSHMGKLIQKAYVDQTSLGWNLHFRGFWAISWRQAQDYEFSQSPVTDPIGQVRECHSPSVSSWEASSFSRTAPVSWRDRRRIVRISQPTGTLDHFDRGVPAWCSESG
jgi:hypothetical protein